MLAQALQGFFAACRLEREDETQLVGEHLAKACAHDLVVIDDGDTQHVMQSGS